MTRRLTDKQINLWQTVWSGLCLVWVGLVCVCVWSGLVWSVSVSTWSCLVWYHLVKYHSSGQYHRSGLVHLVWSGLVWVHLVWSVPLVWSGPTGLVWSGRSGQGWSGLVGRSESGTGLWPPLGHVRSVGLCLVVDRSGLVTVYWSVSWVPSFESGRVRSQFGQVRQVSWRTGSANNRVPGHPCVPNPRIPGVHGDQRPSVPPFGTR